MTNWIWAKLTDAQENRTTGKNTRYNMSFQMDHLKSLQPITALFYKLSDIQKLMKNNDKGVIWNPTPLNPALWPAKYVPILLIFFVKNIRKCRKLNCCCDCTHWQCSVWLMWYSRTARSHRKEGKWMVWSRAGPVSCVPHVVRFRLLKHLRWGENCGFCLILKKSTQTGSMWQDMQIFFDI